MKGLDEIIEDNNPNGDHDEYIKKEFEFDELDGDLQDEVIEDFLCNDDSVYEFARDTLRHFTFDSNGMIIRGYDE